MATVLFAISTPLGFEVRCTTEYWSFISTTKHPVLAGKEFEVQRTLSDPDEIRGSRKASDVFLFYRGVAPRWICAVARRQNGDGFLITAYPTDVIKAGETIWRRSK